MESIFKAPSDIKDFVIKTLNEGSSVNWDKADEYTADEVQELLATSQNRVSIFERAYTVLTDLQDASLAPAIDSVMFGLADAYAAEHTFSTITTVKGVVNG
jgi:hypothetical protein